MNKLTASVSAVILATLAGCTAPVSNGSDEATLASASELRTALNTVTPMVPIVVAGLEFSAAGKASQVYPDPASYSFDDTTTKKIFVWAYMENLTPGIHIAWAEVVNPSGILVATVPLGFSTRKADVGTLETVANWPDPIKIRDGRAGEMETGTGTITGSETHGHFPLSTLAVKHVIATGTYTVNLVMNDTARPAPTQTPVVSRTFTIASP